MIFTARRVIAPTSRFAGNLVQRRGFGAFGDPFAVNPPKVGSGLEGTSTAFIRNKKTIATAADISSLKVVEIPIVEYGLAFSIGLAALAVLFTRVELYRYYKQVCFYFQNKTPFLVRLYVH